MDIKYLEETNDIAFGVINDERAAGSRALSESGGIASSVPDENEFLKLMSDAEEKISQETGKITRSRYVEGKAILSAARRSLEKDIKSVKIGRKIESHKIAFRDLELYLKNFGSEIEKAKKLLKL